jgi:hypothetical protein
LFSYYSRENSLSKEKSEEIKKIKRNQKIKSRENSLSKEKSEEIKKIRRNHKNQKIRRKSK